MNFICCRLTWQKPYARQRGPTPSRGQVVAANSCGGFIDGIPIGDSGCGYIVQNLRLRRIILLSTEVDASLVAFVDLVCVECCFERLSCPAEG